MRTNAQREQDTLEVGRRIARAREGAGLKQAEVASGLGRAQSLISHWETGKREPSLSDLLALAEMIGAPVATLLPDGAVPGVREAFEDGLRRGWRDCELSVREALDRRPS